ncbi:MAG: ECF transporter S component [Clostridiales bacterium]|nr:ECF transporter S component [Clostridiales bacterium]
MKTTNKSRTNSIMNVKKLTTLAVFATVAYVAMLVTHLIPAVSGFLSFDAKDAVIVIAGMVFSPGAAVIVTLVVSFIEMITVGHTGFIGLLMNFISTTSFLLPICFIYKRSRKSKDVILGLLISTVTATAMMLLWNYFITPIYMNVPQSAVVDMMLPVFLPFNLIKYTLNSALVLLIYKRIIYILNKMDITTVTETKKPSVVNILVAILCAAVAITICVMLFYMQ